MLDAFGNCRARHHHRVASDNGPQGEVVGEFGGDMPDMGSPGPFCGELGDVSEGSIRTAALIRWPGRIGPRSSYDLRAKLDTLIRTATLNDVEPEVYPKGCHSSTLPISRSGPEHRVWHG